MKKRFFALSVVLLLLTFPSPATAAPTLQILRDEPGLGMVLRFDIEPGTSGQVQRSSDLKQWGDLGDAVAGGPATEEYVLGVVPTDPGTAFLRVAVTSATAEVAPTPEVFATLVVGTDLLGFGYMMLTETRFTWDGEPGNWSYAKTGPDTGLLVFTYDEDGNDPAVWREEVSLTFVTATTGQFRYSEWWNGVEDVDSVSQGPFSL